MYLPTDQLIFNLVAILNVNISGVWKRPKIKLNILGVWTACKLGYVNVGGTWKPFYDDSMHIEEYVVTVGLFNAPGDWAGFYINMANAGTVSPTSHQGIAIRDMNASAADILGPLYFQFAALGTSLFPKAIRFVSVGIHEKIPFHSNMVGGDAARYFFTNGVTNIYNYLASLAGQTVTIKVWVDN